MNLRASALTILVLVALIVPALLMFGARSEAPAGRGTEPGSRLEAAGTQAFRQSAGGTTPSPAQDPSPRPTADRAEVTTLPGSRHIGQRRSAEPPAFDATSTTPRHIGAFMDPDAD